MFKKKPAPPVEQPVVSTDTRLRDQGFSILSRPDGAPATWIRNHRTYTQDEAVALTALLEQKTAKQGGTQEYQGELQPV